MVYRDPLSNLFCVNFDNASVMGKFHTNVQNLDKANIAIMMDNFVKEQSNSYINTNLNQQDISKASYNVGDMIKASGNDNTFLINGNFYIDELGPYGECNKVKSIKFLTSIDKVTCGYKIVRNLLYIEINR
jgi:hypothetical protein